MTYEAWDPTASGRHRTAVAAGLSRRGDGPRRSASRCLSKRLACADCDADQQIFKGIYMRYLGYLLDALQHARPAPLLPGLDAAMHSFRTFTTTNKQVVRAGAPRG